jgi:hypothetical protein
VNEKILVIVTIVVPCSIVTLAVMHTICCMHSRSAGRAAERRDILLDIANRDTDALVELHMEALRLKIREEILNSDNEVGTSDTKACSSSKKDCTSGNSEAIVKAS